jgi:hypothetical protein
MKIRYLLIVGCFLVYGCNAKESGAPGAPFLPTPIVPTSTGIPTMMPTMVVAPTSSPTARVEVETAHPSATPVCSDNLKFLADLTVPDGTIVARSAMIDKRWQVQNNGSCNWDDRYRLIIISGAEMGLQAEQMLYPARSGAEAVIRILFLSPSKPGTYRSAWQAIGPLGDTFGDIIYVEIRVN